MSNTDEERVSTNNFSRHDDLNVKFTGEVIQQPTDQEPPRIELQFTNEGLERVMSFGPVAPFTGLVDEDITLVLIPDTRGPLEAVDPDEPSTFVPESRGGDCWRALHNPIWRSYLQNKRLDTGDQLTEQYTLLAHADAEGCFPSGTYRFEGTFKIEEHHSLHFDVVVP